MAKKRSAKQISSKMKESVASTCLLAGKHRLIGKKQALSYAAHQRKYFEKEYDIYKCPHCNDYHLTSRKNVPA